MNRQMGTFGSNLARCARLLLVLPLLLLGCGDDVEQGPGVGDGGERPIGGQGMARPGQACGSAADCRSGLQCVDGVCVESCQGAVCTVDAPYCGPAGCVTCLEAIHCDTGFSCAEGACVATCLQEQICDPASEICDPESGDCISTDCDDYPPCGGPRCEGDVRITCVENAVGCEVPEQRNCSSSGAGCVEGPDGPVCRTRCGSDVDCPGDGAVCEDGYCVGACTVDEDCPDRNACNLGACEGGTCTVRAVQENRDAPDDNPGDCRRPICEEGQVRFIADDDDLPAEDGVACTTATCRDGRPEFAADSSLCGEDEVCYVQGGGCVNRDDLPAGVCVPVAHDYDYFSNPVCGDGIADEGCPCEFGRVQRCFNGPPTARGVGACADGNQVCQDRNNPRWGPCTGDVQPRTEVCDGRDTACDGCIDNVPDCTPLGNCPDNEVAEPFRHYELDVTTFFGGDVDNLTWEVIPPVNSNDGVVENPGAAQTRFFMDVSGDYFVTVRIEDDKGGTLVCSWVVSAQGAGLRVELTWDTYGSVDMDLHLQRNDGQSRNWCNGAASGDCHFRNCRVTGNIDWGYAASPDGEACGRTANQTCPNPRLDIDNISGFDPENINLDNPNDGESFRIMALRYSGSRDTYPVVSIYCGGILSGVFGNAPDRVRIRGAGFLDFGLGCSNQGWRVADVTMHVDAGTGATTCSVEPLIRNGDFDVRTGTGF